MSLTPSVATNVYRQTHLTFPINNKFKKSHFWWNRLKELFSLKVTLWRGLYVEGFNLQSALDLGPTSNFNIYFFPVWNIFFSLQFPKFLTCVDKQSMNSLIKDLKKRNKQTKKTRSEPFLSINFGKQVLLVLQQDFCYKHSACKNITTGEKVLRTVIVFPFTNNRCSIPCQ